MAPLQKRLKGPAFLILPLLLLASGCDEQGAQQEAAGAPPPAVIVANATTQDVTTAAEFVGRSVANNRVELRARVTGFIEQRPFQEGGRVEQGDLLYQIEQEEYRADVEAAKAQVARAQAEIVDATAQLDRAQKLAANQNISEAALDEAIAREAKGQADRDAAKSTLVQTQLNLDYTEIRAPIGGRISTSALDVGNLVGPDSGILATIVQTDPIQVRFAVTEREILEYRRSRKDGGAPIYTPKLKLVDGSYLEEEGKLFYLDNEIDPTTGTADLYLLFPNPEELILPGQFLTVVLESGTSEAKVVVPQSAVQSNQAGPFVLVVDADNRVEARPVGLGSRQGEGVVIESGLEAGETYIIEGMQKVRPGGSVTPTQAKGASAGS